MPMQGGSFFEFFVTPYVDEYGDTTYNLTAAGYTGLVCFF